MLALLAQSKKPLMNKTDLINQLRAMKAYDDFEQNDAERIIKTLIDYDNVFSRDNKYMHITSSAWVVNEGFSKILLGFHKIYRSFSWLGGHNDGEIDCLKVALKEVKEESGLQEVRAVSEAILAVDILPVCQHYKNEKVVGEHLHLNICYLLQGKETEKLIVNEKENEALRWFDFAEYEAYVSERRMISVYRKLNNKVQERLW